MKLSTLTVMAGWLAITGVASNCGGGMGTGTGGSTGSAGSAAGTNGGGGNVGTAGTTPATLNVCPNGGLLDCSASGANTLTNGNVTAFTPEEWSNNAGKWCNTSGLRGSIFSFTGGTAATQAVDLTGTRFLKLNLTVDPGSYAGGGISFDSCVNATAFTALEFSASLATAGSMAGCEWQIQLQTQDQRPTTQGSPTGGTCDPDAGASCYRFPAATALTIPDTTPITISTPFTNFNTPSGSAIPLATQIVGIQWQVNSGAPPDGGTQGGCTVELHLDDIKFVTTTP